MARKDGSAFPVPPSTHAAGVPSSESLFVLTVLVAIHRCLIGARALSIDSAPLLAWCRADPDAASGHDPAHHPRPQFAWVARSHPVVSGLRLPRVLPALSGYCPRCPLRSTALAVSCLPLPHPPSCHPSRCWLLLLAPHRRDPLRTGNCRLPSQTKQEPFLLSPNLDGRSVGQTQHAALLRVRVPCAQRLVYHHLAVTFTSTATIMVALAAEPAGRRNLIRSPKRVLAPPWGVCVLKRLLCFL